MRVYRIENENREGPFTYCHRGPDSKWWSNQAYDMPNPYNDGIPLFTSRHICGFEYLQQIFRWFSDDDFRQLDSHGFVLAIYEAPRSEVLLGLHQCAFVRTQSKLMYELSLLDLQMGEDGGCYLRAGEEAAA